MNNIVLRKKALLLVALGSGLAMLKFSHALGSWNFSFTGINVILPLLGGFLSGIPATLAIGFYFLTKFLVKGSLITLGIPTLLASMNWGINTSSKRTTIMYQFMASMLQVVLPLSCMALFVIHPVGQNAFFYTTYWLIPVALYALSFIGFNHSFFTALSSTFIAHAVGSIIWLYSIPMTAEQWLALIPVVAVERLVFASGTSILYEGITSFAYRNLSGQSENTPSMPIATRN